MQLSVSFPDSGFPDFPFITTVDTVVSDVLQAAIEEWELSDTLLEISYSGRLLPPMSKLLTFGVVADSQLIVTARQETITPFKVVARVRPLREREAAFGTAIEVHEESNTVSAVDENGISHHFKFDRAFQPTTSQDTIYQEVGSDAVKAALQGYHTCVISMGVHGAGKTHTIFGTSHNNNQGIIPRMASQLFSEIASGESAPGFTNYSVDVSFMRVYHECISDLLVEERTSLKVRTTFLEPEHIEGLTKTQVGCEKDIIAAMDSGMLRLRRWVTMSSSRTSWDNLIFVITIKSKNIEHGIERCSKITIVDPAEMICKNQNRDCIPSSSVVLSSATLQTVIERLAEAGKDTRSRGFVPFRNSKFVRILKNCFGGNCKTTMILNLSPAASLVPSSICTLKLGTKAGRIHNTVHENYHFLYQ
eukprot:TRINITY_DN23040_c0_g1_i1.p1 TRINITY_DN23040_c0_g1~~TRINITY_DN23040_c0_g1_i1.p1  ORF type:complete len:419 (+),score=63.16 TRINITY_DN23040_c0_g1_i1:63-1319(+)